jgi:hypothetical protein
LRQVQQPSITIIEFFACSSYTILKENISYRVNA